MVRLTTLLTLSSSLKRFYLKIFLVYLHETKKWIQIFISDLASFLFYKVYARKIWIITKYFHVILFLFWLSTVFFLWRWIIPQFIFFFYKLNCLILVTKVTKEWEEVPGGIWTLNLLFLFFHIDYFSYLYMNFSHKVCWSRNGRKHTTRSAGCPCRSLGWNWRVGAVQGIAQMGR